MKNDKENLIERPGTACRHLSVSLEADSSPQGEPGVAETVWRVEDV